MVHPPVELPAWLDRDFVGQLHLAERLSSMEAGPTPHHPWHPRAMASFADPIWQKMLGEREAHEALAPLIWRHPFLDLRLLEFMLSVPPVPWAREKLLLREAMHGRLPDEILARKKTPLAGSMQAQPIRDNGLPALPPNDWLSQYIDVRRLPTGEGAQSDLDRVTAVHALEHWVTKHGP